MTCHYFNRKWLYSASEDKKEHWGIEIRISKTVLIFFTVLYKSLDWGLLHRQTNLNYVVKRKKKINLVETKIICRWMLSWLTIYVRTIFQIHWPESGLYWMQQIIPSNWNGAFWLSIPSRVKRNKIFVFFFGYLEKSIKFFKITFSSWNGIAAN